MGQYGGQKSERGRLWMESCRHAYMYFKAKKRKSKWRIFFVSLSSLCLSLSPSRSFSVRLSLSAPISISICLPFYPCIYLSIYLPILSLLLALVHSSCAYLDRVQVLQPHHVQRAIERGYLEQRGVLRTNCIDCLDRTNVGQFAVGLYRREVSYSICPFLFSYLLFVASSFAASVLFLRL